MTTRVTVEPAVAQWPVWTTTARLLVTDPAVLLSASAAVIEHLARVDAAASRFQPGSEVSRISGGDGSPVEVSPLLAELLRTALAVAELTGGAVDPTLGAPLRDLGRPGAPAVSVRRRTDWQDVGLDGTQLTVPAGTLLDLGASAKAHAADQCATTLVADRLGGGVLVSLGGDLSVRGPDPEGGWTMLVQDGPTEPASTISLDGARAVATSSILGRSWSQWNRRMHHILDPVTCRPAPRGLAHRVRGRRVLRDRERAGHGRAGPGHDRHRDASSWGTPARLVAADGSVSALNGWPTS